MTTSCSFSFILPGSTITIGQDKITAATLTEEISPIGDTVPINKLSLSVLADTALYDQLITAKQVDAYFTADGTQTLLGVYYISDQTMPNDGVCKLELVDIIGKLDTETFMGDYYCANPGTTKDPVGVSYGTYLTDLLGADGYTLDSSLSGTVLGFVSGCTKREALQQFAIATGSVIDPTRGRKIAIRPMPESTAAVITEASKVTGHTLRMDDAVEGVMVTSHKWGYAYDQDGTRSVKGVGATIGWNSTATILYGVPFELASVNGYTDYDEYFRQLGYTKGNSTMAGITLTAPSKIAFFYGDYDTLGLAGYYYKDTTNDFYTDYTAVNPDSTMAVKRVTDAAFAVPGNVAAIASRIYGYYQYRYIAEGTLLPGTVQVGQRVRMTTPRGLLAGYVERVVTDLYGGGLQKVKIRGKLGTGKDPGSLSISLTTMSLDDTTPTGTIIVTRAGDGTISAVSSDTEIATVSVSGTVVTVTAGDKAGYANITVSVAEGTYHAAPPDAVCTITVSSSLPAFTDCTWSEIITACQTGAVPTTWEVGDSKTMTIGGTDYQVDIIGKNHDTYSDGGTAPLTFQLHDSYATKHAMNAQSTNSGGWESSQMRQTSLPAILAAMPGEVQSAIRQVNKLTSGGDKSTAITTTADKLFLLSEVEATGAHSHSVAGEGSQYAYYAAGNSRIKKVGDAAAGWWLRSPYSGNAKTFCQITDAGAASNLIASAFGGIGVSPAWCF